jgi:hypothetical protein
MFEYNVFFFLTYTQLFVGRKIKKRFTIKERLGFYNFDGIGFTDLVDSQS